MWKSASSTQTASSCIAAAQGKPLSNRLASWGLQPLSSAHFLCIFFQRSVWKYFSACPYTSNFSLPSWLDRWLVSETSNHAGCLARAQPPPAASLPSSPPPATVQLLQSNTEVRTFTGGSAVLLWLQLATHGYGKASAWMAMLSFGIRGDTTPPLQPHGMKQLSCIPAMWSPPEKPLQWGQNQSAAAMSYRHSAAHRGFGPAPGKVRDKTTGNWDRLSLDGRRQKVCDYYATFWKAK